VLSAWVENKTGIDQNAVPSTLASVVPCLLIAPAKTMYSKAVSPTTDVMVCTSLASPVVATDALEGLEHDY